ncbi:MAG: YlbF family regulator [Spirochaetaceae bacterium]|nr:MAG: YlbF family regulator [Spirochaetaceae bacterium]
MNTENAAVVPDLDTATKAFAEAVVESAEYREYIRTAELFEKDVEAQSLFEAFQNAQQQLSAQQQWGAGSTDEIQRVRDLEQQVQDNTTLSEHFKAQTELVDTLKELNTIIGEELGFDYAALAMPPKTCCSTGCG